MAHIYRADLYGFVYWCGGLPKADDLLHCWTWSMWGWLPCRVSGARIGFLWAEENPRKESTDKPFMPQIPFENKNMWKTKWNLKRRRRRWAYWTINHTIVEYRFWDKIEYDSFINWFLLINCRRWDFACLLVFLPRAVVVAAHFAPCCSMAFNRKRLRDIKSNLYILFTCAPPFPIASPSSVLIHIYIMYSCWHIRPGVYTTHPFGRQVAFELWDR